VERHQIDAIVQILSETTVGYHSSYVGGSSTDHADVYTARAVAAKRFYRLVLKHAH